MGSGIAEIFSQHGYTVIIQDVSDDVLTAGLAAIEKSLSRLIEKGKLTVDVKKEVLSRIEATLDPSKFSKVDFVLEAATENEAIKLSIFKKLDEVTRPEVILGTNTTSISITKIGAATKKPEKVIGVHFMNPPTILKGVEIIRGFATSDETEKTVRALIEPMGKVLFTANDSPGFISSRVIISMVNEAIFLVHEGVGTMEEIDKGMVACFNHPIGPLALADLIGLDTVLSSLEVMHSKIGDQRYRPCPLLRKYVDAGWLGRKTGRGFYKY